MGSNVAPAYAGTFMNRLEELFIFFNVAFIMHCFALWHSIDDTFALWWGNTGSLSEFDEDITSGKNR